MRNVLKALALAASFVAGAGAAPGSAGEAILWEDWSEGAFARAREQKRLVLLDLGAVWCHWCHVMDETTYGDQKVAAEIRRHFVPLRVDQDARPDLSNRYEDYGWPATIIFDGAGRELVKFAGYIPPPRMLALLEAVAADPTPGPSAAAAPSGPPSTEASLSSERRDELSALLRQRYDRDLGGWGFSKKYLDWDAVEYCLERARGGDREAEHMAKQTLSQARRLIDPVWGGLYQYSDGGDWEHPHFEKLAQFQAEGIRVYAQAYALWGDPADLQAARDIRRYARAFLRSADGAFFVSQDADLVAGEHSAGYYALSDAGRRARGIPRVDTHRYARETAWMANALVALHAVTGDPETLDDAVRAANWILENRALPGGGFRHDDRDAAGPYLGDTLAAGRAFLSLYAATGDRAWLARSRAAGDYIAKTFPAGEGGAGVVAAVARGRIAPPVPQRDENVAAARFANLLFRYTGGEGYRALAARAMRFLATPEVARRFSTASVLLADAELSSEPGHLTVVGKRDDPAAAELLRAAFADPASYKRVELWDRREGPLPNSDVEFPELERSAAFVCANGRCSLPAFTPEELRVRIRKIHGL